MTEFTKNGGIRHVDFSSIVLSKAVRYFNLGDWNSYWDTDLPYGRDWSIASDEDVSNTFNAWNYNRSVWEAMPWGDDAGIWQVTTSGVIWRPWPQYMIDELPDEKPTWDQIWEISRKSILDFWIDYKSGSSSYLLRRNRNDFANAKIKIGNVDEVYVGAGLEHMPALIHAVSSSADAGAVFDPAVFRSRDETETTQIWTAAQAQGVLDKLVAQTNKAESAHNIVAIKIKKLLDPLKDDKGGLTGNPTESEILDAREAALNKILEFQKEENIASEFQKALKNLSEFPTDLPTLKLMMLERLESTGMKHIKYIRGVVSQQGVDLPDTCHDSAEATRQVSVETHRGNRAINAATTREGVTEAFDAAKTRIESVKPLNTPTYHLRGLTAEQPSPATFSKNSAQFTVRNPEGEFGDLSLIGQVIDGNINVIVERQTLNEIDFRIDVGDRMSTIEIVTRNLCGPSKLRVTLIPPEADDDS